MQQENASEYEQERRRKLEAMRALAVNPYGQHVSGLKPLAEIKAAYNAGMGHDAGPTVKGAGRILLKRDMGKLSFLTLRDASGDLQVALDKRRLDGLGWQIRDLLDLGDQIVVEGALGQTNKGETTIWATRLEIGAKALLPPPAKFQGLEDVELRYRQRYVDLWANPEVMRMMLFRSKLLAEVRSFLHGRGYVEVETPMMQLQHGGATARPFFTHHNALDLQLSLRIAPELFLKRLLVGGMPKVFELNRNFRNEGISPRHNPEFTMLEIYEAYGSWETMAELVESLICQLAESLLGSLTIEHRNSEGVATRTINLERPWRRATMAQLVEEKTGWHFAQQSIAENQQAFSRALTAYDAEGSNALARQDSGLQLFTAEEKAKNRATAFERHLVQLSPAEQLVEIYEKLVEPTLIDPCFVTRVPSVAIPLARKCADDPFFADVYELAINGVEISPGYTELNDPDMQAENFQHQVGATDEQQKTDTDFLTALKYGMPPAGGLGLGIDRLIMMLTGAESIRDVILFPLMKPPQHS